MTEEALLKSRDWAALDGQVCLVAEFVPKLIVMVPPHREMAPGPSGEPLNLRSGRLADRLLFA